MGEKKSKWLEHLTEAESSGLKLSAYAANQQIDVRRLYEAKRKRPQPATSNWAVVRIKPDPSVQVTAKTSEVYSQVALTHDLVHLGCWAHCRRYVVGALDSLPKIARTPDKPASPVPGVDRAAVRRRVARTPLAPPTVRRHACLDRGHRQVREH